jgi:periplasmic copper chaperone A
MMIDRDRYYAARDVNLRQPGWMALCVIALVFLIAGTALVEAASGVTVEKPWMRFIIKARPAGGFFTLHNDTSSNMELIGASSTACGMIMLHQTKEIDGVEHMLPVKSVTVPAHGTLSFHPGSYHIMCMKPKDTMIVGHEVPVTLKFAGGQSVTAQFPVKGVGGK